MESKSSFEFVGKISESPLVIHTDKDESSLKQTILYRNTVQPERKYKKQSQSSSDDKINGENDSSVDKKLKIFSNINEIKERIQSNSVTNISSSTIIPVYVGFAGNVPPYAETIDLFEQELVPTKNTTSFFKACVECDIATNPSNRKYIVMAWQQGRQSNGGSFEIGISYSSDFGATWKQTTLPIQVKSGGFSQRVSDVWLDYSSDGKILYLTALPFNAYGIENAPFQSGIMSVTSLDNGATWSPIKLNITSDFALNPLDNLYVNSPVDDKNSITTDIYDPKKAYIVWDRFPNSNSYHSDSYLSRTVDGGATWFAAQKIYDPSFDLAQSGLSLLDPEASATICNIVKCLPYNAISINSDNDRSKSGDLLCFLCRNYAKYGSTLNEYFADVNYPYKFTDQDICVIRSKDHGLTWSNKAVRVARQGPVGFRTFTGGYTHDINNEVSGGIGTFMRDSNVLMSCAVSKLTGLAAVVYLCTDFRSDNKPQIALVISRDGCLTWSEPIMVNRTPQNCHNPQAFTPQVEIADNGHIGIMYVDYRNDPLIEPLNTTMADHWLVIYEDLQFASNTTTNITSSSLNFVREIRLTPTSFDVQLGPKSSQGVMTTADYGGLDVIENTFYCGFMITQPQVLIAPQTIYDDSNGTTLTIDDNVRSQPYFSRQINC